MKPPPSLTKALSSPVNDNAPDDALVKMGTLRSFIARVIAMIPNAGGGISVRRSLHGEIWGGSAAGAAAATHPFQVTETGDANVYLVQAGTCEGQLITTQTIDVGGTRPVAIVVKPEYTLTVYSGQWVHSAVVKTGIYAPYLDSITANFADLTEVGSAGTGAQALIAYIDEADAIAQIATGNINGTFGDSGARDGTMNGNYAKDD